MRIAFVLTSIPTRRALEVGPLDLEWLQGLSGEHSIELFLDQANAASDILRRGGVPTHVSVKRRIDYPDGSSKPADCLQARAMRRSHESSAFDAVIYGGDLTVDLAWFEPVLRTIPRGVALGVGLAHDVRLVWEDRRLFASQVRRTWSLTGLLSSADFMLSDLSPEAFGLVDDGALPPRYGTGSELVRETWAAETGQPSTGEDPSPRWIFVAATCLGLDGLETLVERLIEQCPLAPETTFIVAVRPRLALGMSAKEALLQHCPQDLRRRIVLVETGDDEVAADFLESSDLIVAASHAELAVPAIAQAARQRPLTILDDDADSGSFRQPDGEFPACLPATRSPQDTTRSLHVLMWEEPSSRTSRALANLSSELEGDELVVIHAHEGIGPAVDLFHCAGLSGVDLVVWGRPDGVFSHPSPVNIYPFALAVRGAALPAVAQAARQCDSIWQLICWALAGEWIDRTRLLLLPAAPHYEFWDLEHVESVATTWSPRSGVLPAPRWLPSGGQVVIPTLTPEPLYQPRWRALPMPVEPPPKEALETWVRTSFWRDRIRVAMPWKFGLLDKAMRGRW